MSQSSPEEAAVYGSLLRQPRAQELRDVSSPQLPHSVPFTSNRFIYLKGGGGERLEVLV